MESLLQKKVQELVTMELVDFTKNLQHAQLRLRCAEIVYQSGSQVEKNNLVKEANRLYNFALGFDEDQEHDPKINPLERKK